ncbi:MAG TPA: gamma-glutamylcyclotransferase family protein [Pyrinomonadaceae bacterium]|nr:gamma-glutamylcyclotransferase family protein [Pyrinomonadaceae bacterium]
MEQLFTYGTLQLDDVQLATFGRRLEGRSDVLIGYRLLKITIEDEDFVVKSGTAEHRNLQFTGNSSDFVEGTVFSVTMEELEKSDAYEPEGYERVLVQLKSGTNAWIYLNRHQS